MKQRFIFAAILTLALTSKVFAYDFYSVAPSGQTLYYNFDYTTGGGGVEVTYPGVLDYDDQLYDNCWSGYSKPIGNLTIPSSVSYGGNTYSVTSIGYWAFYGCSGLTSITIPRSVISIGYAAFMECSSISTVYFNADSCIEAGYGEYSAFSNCSNLSTVYFGNNVKSIPSYLCCGLTGLTSINIPNSVTSIGSGAFNGCSGLTSITIPSDVTYIGADAFANCSGIITLNYDAKKCYYAGIRAVIINQHLHGAFYNCANLSIVNFGDSVTAIPQYLFDGCSAIHSISIPESVTYIGKAAFLDCSGLTIVNYYATNCTYAGESGGVAFNTCSNLSSVNFGDSVKIIPPNLFGDCIGLLSVYIPNDVEQIGNNAFKGCDHITNIILGEGLTMIGDSAFRGCTQIVRMTSKSMNPPIVYVNTFNGLSNDVIINVLCGAKNAYENAAYWFRFNLQEDLMLDFSASTGDTAKGTVVVTTAPTCDNREAEIQANAYHGYHFDHWSDGNTDNPRYIVVLQDTHLVAYFASDNGEEEDFEETEEEKVKLFQRNGQIVVTGAEGYTVCLYDVVGRLLATRRETAQEVLLNVPASGAYLVKIGDAPARRIVVRR